jgi:transcriptional regulator with GAF, ATPase, and Fis domain
MTLSRSDASAPLARGLAPAEPARDRFGRVLGGAPAMLELFADLERIAATDLTLLVEGETGTGKDLVAESVHHASARAAGPYVVFDCGAVVPTLVESELFGHERGSFTGATGTRAGVFEQAHGGTLFLDEIGELPRSLQPKLLRVLERREVRRIGSSRTIAPDVRVIAATNRDTWAEVARGQFREDLFFRISPAHVVVPPLRERIDDLPLLVDHFLALEDPGRDRAELPAHVWKLLRGHPWPGNVRELRNIVQALAHTPDRLLRLLARSTTVAPVARDTARADVEVLQPLRIARRQANDQFERDYLERLLATTEGNISRAAARAEVSRQMLQKLLRKHRR